jgi:hypothetical protein
MSRLRPSDYSNVIDLIQAVFRTPSIPGVVRNIDGYLCTDIILSLNTYFPANTMTNEQVCDLLARGARSGVFRRGCSGDSTTTDVSCIESPVTPLYSVNSAMARVNPANKVYIDALNPVTETDTVGVHGASFDPINFFFNAFTTA